MENTDNNPYEAPSSTIVENTGNSQVANFKRFSAWWVFGLSFITLGLYPVYWLYTRVKCMNTFHSNPISHALLNGFITSVILTFVIAFIAAFKPEVGGVGGILNILYYVTYLVVIFSFKNRLEVITSNRFSGVLTFFFGAIYVQYKINEAIDQNSAVEM